MSRFVLLLTLGMLAVAGCSNLTGPLNVPPTLPVSAPTTIGLSTSAPADLTVAPPVTSTAPAGSPTATVPPAQVPLQPTAVPSATVPAGAIATFTSNALGISFNYQRAQGAQTIGVQESGDKIFVFANNTPPTQGQWVQVFHKATNETLENAIKAQVLKGFSAADCQVVKSQDPVGGQSNPATFQFARIDLPRSPNDTPATLSAKAKKCPQPYAAFDGIAYFLADTAHPDRFLFFSIGQYAILAGNNQPWQNTIKFIDTPGQGSGGGFTPPAYLDDRSTPQGVMQSYANAVNRKEYLRAYSYWSAPAGSPSGPPPFDQFQQGLANTASVQLTLGTVTGDAGAGQLYYSVPAVAVAKTTANATQTYAGCYILHLSRPEIQAVPPFHPLGIQSAQVQQVANNSNPATLLAQACQGSPGGGSPPMPTPSPVDPANITSSRYVDDRSGPVEALRSLFNAINRKEYARGYSYWEPGATSAGLPPFGQFEQGYANTLSVKLSTGAVKSDAGAGQLYYSVPVTLVAENTGSVIQTFVGCYTLHLSRPEIQGTPPFQPLAIRSASVHLVANNANTAALMSTSCP